MPRTESILESPIGRGGDDDGHEGAMEQSFGRDWQARLDYTFESTLETALLAGN